MHMPSSWMMHSAVRELRRGALIAYPTEAVWGLGCDPLDEAAVDRLLELKGRPARKGLILIAADFSQLTPFVRPPDPALQDRLAASWPGPTTWLMPARSWVPEWLRGQHDTLAVRVTAHPIAAALCRAFGGPIVSTSANPAGRPPARSAMRVRQYFGPDRLHILPGTTQGLAKPSAIFDAVTGRRLR